MQIFSKNVLDGCVSLRCIPLVEDVPDDTIASISDPQLNQEMHCSNRSNKAAAYN